MISVSKELKEAFLSSSQKDIILEFSDGTTLTNPGVVSESLNFEQSICQEPQLTFGKTNAGKFSIQILNNNKPYKGLWVKPILSVNGFNVPLGRFKIEDDKLSDNRNTRAISAYDSLYGVLQTDYRDWYFGLSFPMTIKQFRDSFFNHIGITQKSIELVNDDVVLERTADPDTLSGQTVIEAICEANAVFGAMSNDDTFRYIDVFKYGKMYPSETLYPSPNIYPQKAYDEQYAPSDYKLGTFVWQDYRVRRITGLSIRESSDDIGVTVGKPDNLYIIGGNFLFYDIPVEKLREIANKILDKCQWAIYHPAKATTRGRPWMELGDFVSLEAKGIKAIFPILYRKMSGITALYDTYEANGSEYYINNPNSITAKVQKLQKQTSDLDAGLNQEILDREYADEELYDAIEEETTRAETIEKEIINNQEQFSISFTEFKNGEATKWSNINQTVNGLSSRVGSIDSELGTVESEISQMSSQIALKLNSSEFNGASIIGEINSAGSSWKIDADHIELIGATRIVWQNNSTVYWELSANEMWMYYYGQAHSYIAYGGGEMLLAITSGKRQITFSCSSLIWDGSNLATQTWCNNNFVKSTSKASSVNLLTEQSLNTFSNFLSDKEVY